MTDSNSFQSPQFPLDLNAPQGNQSPTSMMGNSPGVDDYVPPVVGPQAENTLPKSEPLPDVIASPQLPAQPKPISLLPTQPTGSPVPADTKSVSQTLEDQNIFYLLGIEDGTEAEREEFLDELQQIIWEDFIENDVELLLTQEENQGLKDIQAKTGLKEEEKQEEMVIYLEKYIPDLEDIMLEKALELKEDMMRERVTGMKEYFAKRPDELKKLDQAVSMIDNDQWKDAADLLNSMRE